MASGGTLSSSAGCTDHCNCTAKDTGALLTTASLSARRVPVSSGLSSGMLPCAASAGGGSPPSGRRVSSIFNTCVSERVLPSAGATRGSGGARIRRVSPVALASPSAASTSRTFESSNTSFALLPAAGAAEELAAAGVRGGVCAAARCAPTGDGGARPAAGLDAGGGAVIRGAMVRGAAGLAIGGATTGGAAARRAAGGAACTTGTRTSAGFGAAGARAGARAGAGATRG